MMMFTNVFKEFADNLIQQLGASLKDEESKTRLQNGIYLMVGRPINGLSVAETAPVIMPAFTRTVYDHHGFDTPVAEYVDKLYDFFDQNKTFLKRGYLKDEDFDPEADALENLTNEFMDTFQ